LKFASATNASICGSQVSPRDVAVRAGWNIIGPYESDVATGSVTSTPSGIVSTSYFAYQNGYASVTTLQSGKGYWVKVTQAGLLHLPASASKTGTIASTVDPSWAHIEVTDATGQQRVLYLSHVGQMPANPDLPPIPPSGIFDVRYANDEFVQTIGGEHMVMLNSAAFPLTIRASNLNGLKLRVKDGVGGTLANQQMEEGQPVTILHQIGNLRLTDDVELPADFELSQNYPNPFNPTTAVSFQLPEASQVKLVVFDLLGHEVAMLADEKKPAGVHNVQVDASGLASGVYLYRLTAGNFVQTRKMIVVK
jgi:hypothetical protein